jgi:hypothetical protein
MAKKHRTRADVAAQIKSWGYKFSYSGEYAGRPADFWRHPTGPEVRAYTDYDAQRERVELKMKGGK